MKARDVSVIVKICTCVFIVVCCVLKWLGVFGNATVAEICIAGGTLAGIFGDVSVNLMLEKWRGKNAETVGCSEYNGSGSDSHNGCGSDEPQDRGCED